MPAIERALVVGGGIGGLAAGVALRQQGVAVDLVELKPDLSVYGVGIIQPNNTLRALAKVGLAQACVGVGAPFPGWRIHDAAGNVLMDAPSTSDADPSYPPNNGITRPKLHKILTTAAQREGVDLRFGDTIDTMEDGADCVTVRFTSGRSGRYGLIIGSDGIYSDLRRRLFGDQHQPRFTGQGVWRYNLPRPAGMEWGQLFFGPHSKVGLVPMSRDLMYMLIVTAEPGNPRLGGDGMAEAMRQRLETFSGPIDDLKPLITDPAGVVYRPMETMLLPAPWMKGRTLLIGDAAHSTTPHLAQGAAIAIEDAVLIGELMGRDAPVPALLDEFMARRFARAKHVIDSSVQIGEWEMEQWRGVHNPAADPGGLLHRATLAMMDAY